MVRYQQMICLVALCGCSFSQSRDMHSNVDRPDEVHALLERINADADMLHADHTPAGTRLVEIGEPAILPCLEIMASEDQMTRMRAERVLVEITRNLIRKEFPNASKQQLDAKWDQFWMSHGDLDFNSNLEKRAIAIESLKRWAMNTRVAAKSP